MPQLDTFSFDALTSASLVIFLMILFIMHTYYLPQIGLGLKLRHKLVSKSTFIESSFRQVWFAWMTSYKIVNGYKTINMRLRDVADVYKIDR
jgi:hypothetical protein